MENSAENFDDGWLDRTDFTSVPETLTLPEQAYNLEIVELTHMFSQKPTGDKLVNAGKALNRTLYANGDDHCKRMSVVTYEVIEPPEFRNRRISEFFVFGSDADPKVKDLATLDNSFGAVNFKQLLLLCGIPLTQARHLVHNRIAAYILEELDDKGILRNRVGKKYRLGEINAGDAIPVSQKGKKRTTRSTGNVNSVDGSINTTCPSCQLQIPQSELIMHVATCNK